MKPILLFIFLSLSSFLTAQSSINIGVQLADVTETEKVYNFVVSDFENIVGWQFYMHFDSTRMKFKEIRNSILDDMTSHCFNEPTPGNLITVWIDKDLMAANYTDTTVVFQIVFDVLQPGGSPLCFFESHEYFEFIVEEIPGMPFLSEVIVDDECNSSLSIFLGTTNLNEAASTNLKPVSLVYLSQNGELAFTVSQDLNLQLTLYNSLGLESASIGETLYTSGRHTLNIGRSLTPGIYVLRTRTSEGHEVTTSVFAR